MVLSHPLINNAVIVPLKMFAVGCNILPSRVVAGVRFMPYLGKSNFLLQVM